MSPEKHAALSKKFGHDKANSVGLLLLQWFGDKVGELVIEWLLAHSSIPSDIKQSSSPSLFKTWLLFVLKNNRDDIIAFVRDKGAELSAKLLDQLITYLEGPQDLPT